MTLAGGFDQHAHARSALAAWTGPPFDGIGVAHQHRRLEPLTNSATSSNTGQAHALGNGVEPRTVNHRDHGHGVEEQHPQFGASGSLDQRA